MKQSEMFEIAQSCVVCVLIEAIRQDEQEEIDKLTECVNMLTGHIEFLQDNPLFDEATDLED